MKNFVQPGLTVPVTAPAGGVLSGQFIVVGHLAGVASYDAAAGTPVELAIAGVFDIGKDSSTFAQGDKVNFAAGKATSGAGTLIGAATEAAGTGATTRSRSLSSSSAYADTPRSRPNEPRSAVRRNLCHDGYGRPSAVNAMRFSTAAFEAKLQSSARCRQKAAQARPRC
jgi:predicted RecA/RadA family phage recombinase